jgi:hypothetical protein
VKSFQTALYIETRKEQNKNIFATRNDLAFIVSDVQVANSLLNKTCRRSFLLCIVAIRVTRLARWEVVYILMEDFLITKE